MCENNPQKVSISKKSALDRASIEFGLHSASELKKFIVYGLENATEHLAKSSVTFPGTCITAVKFNSGNKIGYLAFHQNLGDPSSIHIKSFHLDDRDVPLGTLKDLMKNIKLGEKK